MTLFYHCSSWKLLWRATKFPESLWVWTIYVLHSLFLLFAIPESFKRFLKSSFAKFLAYLLHNNAVPSIQALPHVFVSSVLTKITCKRLRTFVHFIRPTIKSKYKLRQPSIEVSMKPKMTTYTQNVAIILSLQRIVCNLLFLRCVRSN